MPRPLKASALFELCSDLLDARVTKGEWALTIALALNPSDEPRSYRQLAALAGVSLSNFEPLLRQCVKNGRVERVDLAGATANPTAPKTIVRLAERYRATEERVPPTGTREAENAVVSRAEEGSPSGNLKSSPSGNSVPLRARVEGGPGGDSVPPTSTVAEANRARAAAAPPDREPEWSPDYTNPKRPSPNLYVAVCRACFGGPECMPASTGQVNLAVSDFEGKGFTPADVDAARLAWTLPSPPTLRQLGDRVLAAANDRLAKARRRERQTAPPPEPPAGVFDITEFRTPDGRPKAVPPTIGARTERTR